MELTSPPACLFSDYVWIEHRPQSNGLAARKTATQCRQTIAPMQGTGMFNNLKRNVMNTKNKHVVFLTGAGMSAESGIKTFRGNDGLWENYPVMQVASHEGWLADPNLVNQFYNERRQQLFAAQPNKGHLLIAELEKRCQVTVITQNVDDLHERAGSSHVIHLHGELLKVCSSADPNNPRYIRTLTPDNAIVTPDEKAADGSRLRPFIVFFGEPVPLIDLAARTVRQADVLIVIGTSLNVYPAAGLLAYAPSTTPIYLIDPEPVETTYNPQVKQLRMGASQGMEELIGKI